MTPVEVRALLAELDRRLGAELGGFWRAIAESDPAQFRALLIDAYPEIVTPYVSSAAALGAEWYDSAPSTTDYRAVPAEPVPVERLTQSVMWALNVGTAETGLSLLTGSASRALFDGLRDTVVENAAAEPGARWARHASANACGFCRMIATRHVGDNATFYRSEASAAGVVGRGADLTEGDRRAIAAGLMTREEALKRRSQYVNERSAARAGRKVGDSRLGALRGSQSAGDGYHDHCHCIATMIRPGESFEPPPYYEQWNDDYIAATRKAREEGRTRGEYGAIDPKVISRLMDPAHAH